MFVTSTGTPISLTIVMQQQKVYLNYLIAKLFKRLNNFYLKSSI